MSAIRIRLAEARDDTAVGELLVRAFVTSYAQKMPLVQVSEQRKADLRAVAAKRAMARVWVAERDERGARVIGTIAAWAIGAEGSEAWLPGAIDLRHLAVDASAKGYGVSAMLIEVAEGWARAQGAKTVCLHVRRGVTGVRRLYESRGYVSDPKGDLDLLPDVYLEALYRAL